MALDFPFRIDPRGRSAEVVADAHIRQMIEQVLFTVPGERVNRPDFGCGLLQPRRFSRRSRARCSSGSVS